MMLGGAARSLGHLFTREGRELHVIRQQMPLRVSCARVRALYFDLAIKQIKQVNFNNVMR